MYFISENGAVIYHGNQLYNYRSFDRTIYEKVVNYIHLDRHIDEFIICGLKSAYILKDTSEAFKKMPILLSSIRRNRYISTFT